MLNGLKSLLGSLLGEARGDPSTDEHQGFDQTCGQQSVRALDQREDGILAAMTGEGGNLGEEASLSGQNGEISRWRETVREGLNRIAALPEADGTGYGQIRINDVKPQALRRFRRGIEQFKPLEANVAGLRLLDDPATTLSDISQYVLRNPTLSGRVLRCANSAGLGARKEVKSVQMAILLMGLKNLRSLLHLEHFLQSMEAQSGEVRTFMAGIWEHSVLTSLICSHAARAFSGLDPNVLYTCGILHDIGKFVIASSFALDDGEEDFLYDDSFSVEDENGLFGVNHVVIGAEISRAWSLPEFLVNVIELMHLLPVTDRFELKHDDETVRCSIVLFIADQLARSFASGSDAGDIQSLHYTYHRLFDPRRMERYLLDASLFLQIDKARRLIVEELK